MNKTTKILLGIAIILIVIWGGISFSKNKSSNEPVKIGAILPLLGDLAPLGEEVKRGMEIAASENNLNIVYEDDQYTPTKDVSAAQKLINIDKVNAVLTMFVEEAKPMAPVFNSAKVPLLVTWDSNDFIKSNDYLFSNGFSTEKAGEAMAEYAYNKLNLKTVAIISHIDPWADIISKSFKEKFESLGGKIVYDEKFQVDVTDYRVAIAQIKSKNPDGVYFPLMPMNNSKFIIQAKQLGLNKPLITGDTLIQDVITETGIASNNIVFTNIYSDNSSDLIKKYKTKYNIDPIDPTLVSFGYDGINKIAQAIKKEGSSREEIKKGLEETIGKDRSVDRIEKIYKVQNGNTVNIQ